MPDPSGSGRKIDDFWEPSKKALSDAQFVSNLKSYDKDNIPPRIIDTIRANYTSNEDFTPANAAKASSAAEGLCKWVCAIERCAAEELQLARQLSRPSMLEVPAVCLCIC